MFKTDTKQLVHSSAVTLRSTTQRPNTTQPVESRQGNGLTVIWEIGPFSYAGSDDDGSVDRVDLFYGFRRA